jgi:hypothetical protein
LASPAGLEPATYSLGNCCSIRLSYGDTQRFFALLGSLGTADPLVQCLFGELGYSAAQVGTTARHLRRKL